MRIYYQQTWIGRSLLIITHASPYSLIWNEIIPSTSWVVIGEGPNPSEPYTEKPHRWAGAPNISDKPFWNYTYIDFQTWWFLMSYIAYTAIRWLNTVSWDLRVPHRKVVERWMALLAIKGGIEEFLSHDPSGSERDMMSGQISHRCEMGVRPKPGYDNLGTPVGTDLIPSPQPTTQKHLFFCDMGFPLSFCT